MHIAIQNQDVAIIKKLLANGFDPDMRDARGTTPLMRLVTLPLNAESQELLRLLLLYRADLKARDNQGLTVKDHSNASGFPAWQSTLGKNLDE